MAENLAAEDREFAQQCAEAGEKIANILTDYPKAVQVCVIPGVLASVSKVYGLPRAMVIAMLDSALEDING
jgi:hypothetical protein